MDMFYESVIHRQNRLLPRRIFEYLVLPSFFFTYIDILHYKHKISTFEASG